MKNFWSLWLNAGAQITHAAKFKGRAKNREGTSLFLTRIGYGKLNQPMGTRQQEFIWTIEGRPEFVKSAGLSSIQHVPG